VNPVCKTTVCATGLRIVRSGGVCPHCKVNGKLMVCYLGIPEGHEAPVVVTTGMVALGAARAALLATGPSKLCSYDEKGTDRDGV
jgi:hypothetical protein